jgi:hypothetical protein
LRIGAGNLCLVCIYKPSILTDIYSVKRDDRMHVRK